MAFFFKNQSETQLKTEFKKAFKKANTFEEIIVAFKNMESHFPEKELGYECLLLAIKLELLGENPEKIIRFGKRALKNLLHNEQDNLLLIVCPLRLLSTVCYRLDKYEQSLRYLKWAEKNLDNLDQEQDCVPNCGGECNMHCLLGKIQLDLFRLYSRIGKRDEAAFHMERVLKVEERMSHDKGCVNLGDANRDVCNAYMAAMNFEAALPFGLKALGIYKNFFGYESVEVAHVRRFLGVIYCELGEYVKAGEQNQSSFSLLRSIGHAELIDVETERCNVMIANGEYEKAMKGLKAVVSNFRTDGADRGVALVCMSRAFCYMEKFDKADKYMKLAQEILEKEDIHPLIAAVGFGDMSVLYEMMGDFETALSLTMRVLNIPELPQKLLVDGTTRLFSLIMLAGIENEGVAFLEDVAEKLKARLGPEHSQVGYCYATLGETCRRLRLVRKTIKYLTLAKDVMDVSLGPNHLDSLKISQTIARLYTSMLRYDEAVSIQERVVQGLRDLIPGEQAFMDEAVRVLDEIKGRKNSWCSIL